MKQFDDDMYPPTDYATTIITQNESQPNGNKFQKKLIKWFETLKQIVCRL